MMSECELCGKSENYCNKCSTCLDCIDREHEETVKELERLRAQVAELKAERDRLRFNGVRAVSILEVVHGLADSALERKDLEAAIKLLEES